MQCMFLSCYLTNTGFWSRAIFRHYKKSSCRVYCFLVQYCTVPVRKFIYDFRIFSPFRQNNQIQVRYRTVYLVLIKSSGFSSVVLSLQSLYYQVLIFFFCSCPVLPIFQICTVQKPFSTFVHRWKILVQLYGTTVVIIFFFKQDTLHHGTVTIHKNNTRVI